MSNDSLLADDWIECVSQLIWCWDCSHLAIEMLYVCAFSHTPLKHVICKYAWANQMVCVCVDSVSNKLTYKYDVTYTTHFKPVHKKLNMSSWTNALTIADHVYVCMCRLWCFKSIYCLLIFLLLLLSFAHFARACERCAFTKHQPLHER